MYLYTSMIGKKILIEMINRKDRKIQKYRIIETYDNLYVDFIVCNSNIIKINIRKFIRKNTKCK